MPEEFTAQEVDLTQDTKKRSRPILRVFKWVLAVLLVLSIITILGYYYVVYYRYPATIRECFDIESKTEHVDCIYQQTLLKKDSSYCALITSGLRSWHCIQEIEQNPDICGNYKSYEEIWCYTASAAVTGDLQYCQFYDKGLGPELIIASDISDCVIYAARARKNTTICATITEKETQRICYRELATEAEDVAYCETFLQYQDECFYEVFLNTQDPTLCYRMGQGSLPANNCFESIAKTQNDPQLCEKIGSLLARDYCYENVGSSMGNETLCERINEKDIKDDCYYGAYTTHAINQRDVSLCSKIEGEDRQRCEGQVTTEIALMTTNADLCGTLSGMYRTFCYYQLAEATETVELCEKIENKIFQANCRDSLLK